MNQTSPQLDEMALRTALAAKNRPDRPSPLAASLTFGWRALLKIKHVPQQLLDLTVTPIMFTLLFTYLFGGALAGSTGDYLQFVLPGVLVQSILFVTMYTGVALNTDISKGIFDRIRSLPIWRPSAIVGALLGDAVRYTLSSLVVVGLGLLLGYRPAGGVLGVVLAVALLLLFAFSLSWLWTLLGLVLETPESVTGISSTLILPLTLVSNSYVDPQTMPRWLEFIVNLNPVTYLVTAVRGLMSGTATTAQIFPVFVACAVLIALFAPLTMLRYRNKGNS